MALATLVYPVLVFWLVAHAVHRFRSGRGTQSILPSLTSSGAKTARSSVKVTLKHAYLCLDSSGLNALHDRTTQTFARSRRALWNRAAYAFYNVGSVAGTLGMLTAIYLLCSTAWWSVSGIRATDVWTTGAAHSFRKRSMDAVEQTGISPHDDKVSGSAPVYLIIPGVTLPLSHLPMLIIALFACQVVHEAGHAITAAMESVPLLSVGASLTVILPSAYVALPAASVEKLSPHARLRVISSGAFHNLVLWALLAFLSWLGLGGLLWSCLGYQDISTYGRAVLYVDEQSPLHGFLPRGAIITKLDDTSLASADRSQDVWSSHLSSSTGAYSHESLGWCMSESWFLTQRDSCCTRGTVVPNSSCFAGDVAGQHAVVSEERCAPTLDVLRPDLDVPKRCIASADCTDTSVCVRLRGDQQVTRIEYVEAQDGKPSSERVVVWSGPPEELLEDVETSTYVPRFGVLPAWAPSLFTTLVNYVSTLTLSLYLFNLLPLPFLDGSQMLDALADLAQTRSTVLNHELDIEEGRVERARSPHTREWGQLYPRAKRGLQVALQVLLLVCLGSAAWRAMQ